MPGDRKKSSNYAKDIYFQVKSAAFTLFSDVVGAF